MILLGKYVTEKLMGSELVVASHTQVAATEMLSTKPAAVYVASLAPGSRPAMEQALNAIAVMLGHADAASCPWHCVNHQVTGTIRARLQSVVSPATGERLSPATCNKMLSALRGVLRAAWRLGLMDTDTFQRAVDIPPVKGNRLEKGRCLDQAELRALFAACDVDERPVGRRDAALLALLYGAGLRRSECASLELSDFSGETRELYVRHAKGNKQRIVFLTAQAVSAVSEWLAVRGTEPGPLFVPVYKGQHIDKRGRGMTAQAIRAALSKRAKQAGVRHFCLHDFRRSFVSSLLASGADAGLVKRLVGHANVNTTIKYDKRPDADTRRAAELLQVPFKN
jgi:site-specific recombinase XerD